ncbi:MAG TPA: family 65 glycosyl hydrolase [Treponema sp.]|nr:family 65 glycosyl hydrolase [Treponema sp.]
MTKIADEYIVQDPWKIIESGWNPEHSLVSESLFSLGNEYMGVRGYFEEGTSAPSLLGSYFNGIYETEKTSGTAYKGIIKKAHFMVNAVDWLYTRVMFDGEELDCGMDESGTSVSDYSRVLDMRNGTLTRSFVRELHDGRKIRMEFMRVLDMTDVSFAYQRITVRSLNFSGSVRIRLACDFNTVHKSRNKCCWKELQHSGSKEMPAVMARTLTTNQKIFSGFVWTSNKAGAVESFSSDKLCGVECILPLSSGEDAIIEKKICNIVDKNNEKSTEALWSEGLRALEELKKHTLQHAVEKQTSYWNTVWESSDIEIDGDLKNQQGIRFCIFQMQQTYHGQNRSDNIGAKGLTGEAYNGHAFWDTETYCLPFFLYSNVQAAKSLLEFRYETLPQAKSRAAELDCKGACYPVATLNGEEGCDLWQHASLQFQPSTGVAYGIAHYASVTGDTDFLYSHGIEMLVEISRFLASRGSWNSTKTGFGFYAVMGPDEFHMMVNNNVYTNITAKKTFDYTLETLSEMERTDRGAYAAVEEKLHITGEEKLMLKECSEKMIILYDEKTKLYEQHEGYFGLPHIDINKIPVTDFPLYDHWSYDRIYRTDMLKQPDVLMFLFLYRNEFPAGVLEANYEFYEPRTIHESSLSPSVHSILAEELGKKEEAFRFFGFATRLDLDNYNRNTGDGLHMTSIAAAWVDIVFGFGGMRSEPGTDGVLSVSPVKPAQWKKYSFRLVYKGVPVLIEVTDSAVSIRPCAALKTPLKISVYGKPLTLDSAGITVPLREISNK